jgi:hypothetical protein
MWLALDALHCSFHGREREAEEIRTFAAFAPLACASDTRWQQAPDLPSSLAIASRDAQVSALRMCVWGLHQSAQADNERESVYVFIDGDAGVGKTRLLDAALLPDAALTWLRVSFEQTHASQPFAAIATVVRNKLRQLIAQPRTMDMWRAAFRRHLEVPISTVRVATRVFVGCECVAVGAYDARDSSFLSARFGDAWCYSTGQSALVECGVRVAVQRIGITGQAHRADVG